MIRRGPNPYGNHFAELVGFLLVALLALISTSAHAAGEFSGQGPTGVLRTGDSVSIVANLIAADHGGACAASFASIYAGQFRVSSTTYGGTTSGGTKHQWHITTECLRTNGSWFNAVNSTIFFTIATGCPTGSTLDTGTGECVPDYVPEQCNEAAGSQEFLSGPGSAPGSICHNGCAYTPAGGMSVEIGGYFGANYVTQGAQCTGSEGANPTDEEVGLNCIFDGAQEFCADTNSTENCGTLNGEYVCLDDVPPGNCLLTPGGQAVCDGTIPGATPTGMIDGGDGPLNVYGNGAGGSTGTQTGSDNGNANDQGSGQGDGEGEGSNVETPGIDDDGCDFGCISQQFYNNIATGPIASAVNLSLVSGASACPAPSFSIFDTTYTIDAHCTLGDSIKTILQLIMVGIWAFVGTRIVLKA